MNPVGNPRYWLVFVWLFYNCVSVQVQYLEGDVMLGGLFVTHLENSEGQ